MEPNDPSDWFSLESHEDPSGENATTLFREITQSSGQTARAGLRARLRQLHYEALPVLIDSLASDDAYVRWEAINLLGELALPECSEALVQHALIESDGQARWRAFWAVSQLPRGDVLPTLLQAMSARSWQRRWNAALMLSMLDAREAVPVILEALRKPDPDLNLEALGAAKTLADPALARPVARFIEIDQPPPLRQEATLALGHIGGLESRRALYRVLDDPDPAVRWRAAMAFARFGKGARERLASRLTVEQDPMVLQTLPSVCGQDGAPGSG